MQKSSGHMYSDLQSQRPDLTILTQWVAGVKKIGTLNKQWNTHGLQATELDNGIMDMAECLIVVIRLSIIHISWFGGPNLIALLDSAQSIGFFRGRPECTEWIPTYFKRRNTINDTMTAEATKRERFYIKKIIVKLLFLRESCSHS